MTEKDSHDPLLNWNRLARENAEVAVVSSMFEAGFQASEPLEKFSTWVLIGTTAIAAFLITNASTVLLAVRPPGFITCACLLLLSGVLGLVARMYGLLCGVRIGIGSAIRKSFAEHMAAYQEEEAAIKKDAAIVGITLETGLRLDRVMALFLEHMPRIMKWAINRGLEKTPTGPHKAHWMVVRTLHWQLLYVVLQVLVFLLFLASGFYSVATGPLA
jgi:hypothetical protein